MIFSTILPFGILFLLNKKIAIVIILEGVFSKNDFLTSFSSDYDGVCKNFRVELNEQLRFIS